MRLHSSRKTFLTLVGVTSLLAACSDPTSSTLRAPGAVRGHIGDYGQFVKVCKASGTLGRTYSFSVASTGPSDSYLLPSGSAFQLPFTTADDPYGQCVTAWQSVLTAASVVPVSHLTITETNIPADETVTSIRVVQNGEEDILTGTNSVTLDASFVSGAFVFFYNGPKPPPPPPTGIAGCTPGYWKQTQHFGSWVGYTPTGPSAHRWNAVFGRNVFASNPTLLVALGTGGGGTYRFGRHSTAALLNSANSAVDFGMSTSAVIAAVQAAVDAGTTDALATRFESMNERGCPLGRAELVP